MLEDIIRDEPVSFWEAAEGARVSRVCRLVLQEGLGWRKVENRGGDVDPAGIRIGGASRR